MARKPLAVGAYIFAGGFTLGVKRAGFRVLAQLEEGAYGVETTRVNHRGLDVFTDPDTWPVDRIAKKAKGDPIGFVYANPPCAPFSNAGVSIKKIGRMNDHWTRDPRVGCIRNAFRLLEELRPNVWAWESVQPALRRGRPLVEELTDRAAEFGYAASYVLMNAADIGVPQIRKRFFCVFHNVEIDWEYDRIQPYRTVGDALEPITSGAVIDMSPDPPPPTHNREHLRLLKLVPPGGSLRRAWDDAHPPSTHKRNKHGGVIGRPRFLDVRLAFDRPCPTLTGGATKFHPIEDRYVTLLEQQLLCGYPPEYEFRGRTLAERYAQTAQAVMPPVGEWLARNVRRAIDRRQEVHPNSPHFEDRIVDLEGKGRGTEDRDQMYLEFLESET